MRALFAILICAGIAAATWFQPQSFAQTTFPAPIVTVTTLSGGGQQIITQNPSRRSIRICNTGATNAVWIWALSTSAAATTVVSQYILAAVASSVISCYTPPNGVVGGAGARWAASPNAASGTVSVEEW